MKKQRIQRVPYEKFDITKQLNKRTAFRHERAGRAIKRDASEQWYAAKRISEKLVAAGNPAMQVQTQKDCII